MNCLLIKLGFNYIRESEFFNVKKKFIGRILYLIYFVKCLFLFDIGFLDGVFLSKVNMNREEKSF